MTDADRIKIMNITARLCVDAGKSDEEALEILIEIGLAIGATAELIKIANLASGLERLISEIRTNGACEPEAGA